LMYRCIHGKVGCDDLKVRQNVLLLKNVFGVNFVGTFESF